MSVGYPTRRLPLFVIFSFQWLASALATPFLGNGWNTVSRVLIPKRELTEFCGKLGEFCEKKLGEFALAHES